MKIEKVRKMAYAGITTLDYVVKESPMETLRSIKFNIPVGQFIDQRTFAEYNMLLDNRSCLGRVAQVAAIVEKHFPECKLEIAEVRKDYLAGVMLDMLKRNRQKSLDPSFMEELLMYEEPHLVLLVSGVQFEPLSLQYGQDITHPEVEAFPLWEGLAASVTVSESHFCDNPMQKLEILSDAKNMCQEMILVDENMCLPLELLGLNNVLLEKVRLCCDRRPCARNLYVLAVMTGDEKLIKRLYEMYSQEIVKYF